MALFPSWQSGEKPLHVVVILGTARKGRVSERVAKFVVAFLKKQPHVTVELVDVRSFDIPHDDYGDHQKDTFPEYGEAVKRAEAFVVVTPEYNHGYPGQLKTLLDILYPEYKHKPVTVVGVSSGPWGGVRVVENLLPVLRELGLIVSQLSLNVSRAEEVVKPDGMPIDTKLEGRAEKVFAELLWLGKVFRWGRANVKEQ